MLPTLPGRRTLPLSVRRGANAPAGPGRAVTMAGPGRPDDRTPKCD